MKTIRAHVEIIDIRPLGVRAQVGYAAAVAAARTTLNIVYVTSTKNKNKKPSCPRRGAAPKDAGRAAAGRVASGRK